MSHENDLKFRQMIAPHFDAAYNLARWLTGSDADAADVLQDSSLKAFRFIASMNSENPRAWFLQIIRNTSYTLLKARQRYVEIDVDAEVEDSGPSAEDLMLADASAQALYEALTALPLPCREILILREFEELSYEDIAEVLQVPIGTVMSRLARARSLIKKKMAAQKGLI